MATRGRPPALSRAAVLDGALSLLDDAGLDAFSMRALGTRLGADPMAVYHYFPSRTALLDGVVERIFAEVVPPERTGDWTVDVTASTHAFRDAVLAHPAAIPLMAMRPAVTPDAFRITESLLEALAPAGLSARDALDVAQALGRGPVLIGDRGNRLFLLALVALQHRLVDRLLGIEEAIDVGGAHPQGFGDVRDGRLLVPDIAEEALGGVDDDLSGIAFGVTHGVAGWVV